MNLTISGHHLEVTAACRASWSALHGTLIK
jgi:ribosome-associated translation inhibitor RaiA